MMMEKVSSDVLYVVDEGWRTSRYHFSFADYKDHTNNQYGVLRALNDELIQPRSGFDMHPHDEMEIISYCVQGELSHSDNMGNQGMIRRGDVQYMCAGSGITHAEMNDSTTQTLRFIQVWILPDQRQLHPHYDCRSYSTQVRRNKFLQIASGTKIDGTFQIHQDANVFVSEITKGFQVLFTQSRKRQSYLVCLEGNMDVNGIELQQHEALRSSGEMELIMSALDDSHLLMVEIPEG
jgi:redox-sensitive bicupin YhaK (pirin superfamily)